MKITVDPLPPNLSSPNYTVRYGDPAFSIINSVTTSSSGTLIFKEVPGVILKLMPILV